MAQRTAPLLPASEQLLVALGERLRLARLRRRLPAKQVAERAGMAPMTLRAIERGHSGVTIGAYLAVMQVLGVERDLAKLALLDSVGRELQDARLPTRARIPAPRRTTRVSARSRSWATADPRAAHSAGVRDDHSRTRGAADKSASNGRAVDSRSTRDDAGGRDASVQASGGVVQPSTAEWIRAGQFASSQQLADLLEPADDASRSRRANKRRKR